jgi:hypothetical protein
MLLDTIKRHDSQGVVKLACIEHIRAKRQQVPPQIHSVPALLLLPNKHILFGKSVFDYLLLPGSGKLLVSVGAANNNSNSNTHSDQDPIVPSASNPGEPLAYSMSSSSGLSDAFAMIDEDVHPMNGMNDRAYTWASLDTNGGGPTVFADSPMQEETRSKKQLPDIDSIRAQRDMELKQSDINTNTLIPPSFTR